MILWCFLYEFAIISFITFGKDFSVAFSSLSAYSDRTFPTIAFITAAVVAGVELEPGILNSNLFPVNANGEVLFLSPASILNVGNTSTDKFTFDDSETGASFLYAILLKIVVNSSPKKIEIIVGGASCPPNLWSFVAVAVAYLNIG